MLLSEEKKPDLRYAWYVVGVLMIAYIFSFIDRQILSLLVTPIKRDMHLSDTQMSMLMGLSFALFYTLLGLPFGRLADTANRKWIITFGIVMWSLTTAMCGLVTTFSEFFIARMLVGIGEATLSPAAYSMISDYFPKEKLARAISVYGMGIYLGSGLALVLGGAFVYLVGNDPIVNVSYLGKIFNWQLIFFYVGLPGILVALLMASVREPARRGVAKGKSSNLPLRVVVAYILQNGKAFFLLSAGFGFYTMVTYSSAGWVPTFLERTYGWSRGQAGVVYGVIVTVMSTLGIVAGGMLADYWKKRGIQNAKVWIIPVAIAGFLPLSVLFPLMPDPWLAVALLAPTAFFASFPLGAGPAAIQEMMPNQMRAFASALFLFILNLMGLGFGPTGVALITDYVLQDASLLRYSLIINAIIALSLSFVCVWLALKPFNESLDRVNAWEEKHL